MEADSSSGVGRQPNMESDSGSAELHEIVVDENGHPPKMEADSSSGVVRQPNMESDSRSDKLQEIVVDENDHPPKMEADSSSGVVRQPNMERNSSDSRSVKLQEIVADKNDHPPKRETGSSSRDVRQPNMESDSRSVELPEIVWDEDGHPPQVEIGTSSRDVRQPNMESDLSDSGSVEHQEIVDTGHLSVKFELLLSALGASLFGRLNNAPKQILGELENWGKSLLETRVPLANAGKKVSNDRVTSWLADMMEMLIDMEDLLDETMDAYRSRLIAEDQSSANKPCKLILNLFNKVSRFMHYYRDKEMASKMKDITVRLHELLAKANRLNLPDGSSTEDTFDLENLGRKKFALLNDIYKGKFWKVRGFSENNPEAIFTTSENGQTALHVAITGGQLSIAVELIISANRDYLGIKDERGNTALSLAARSGMVEIAKCLIERNKKLLTIPDDNNKIPVQLASSAGHENMTRFLYRNTPKRVLKEDHGFYLLEECITKKMFVIALDLLRSHPKFAVYKIYKDSSRPIISTLAQTPPPIFRRNQLTFWRQWIYNCIRVKVDEGRVLSSGTVSGRKFAGGRLSCMAVHMRFMTEKLDLILSKFLSFFGYILPRVFAKQIYDLKLMDAIAYEIIHFIRRRLSTLNKDQFKQSGAVEATFQAIKNGILEIVIELTKVNTNILWDSTDPEDSRNMFACAVANRQEEVAHFLYGFNAGIGTNIAFTTDGDGNNLLHLAAKLAPRSQLDCISGAALQLQSELRWFKAVEGIVPQFDNYHKNNDGQTPSQVFVKEHKQLLKEAEEWLKKTAEASTVVGALIITIMFAVAFTVPGGNNQTTGFPIFLNKTADSSTTSSLVVPFMVFVASDAISLFAASSSVLMFLGILTSRYAHEDFLKSLPVKLIIGISSLFISIAAMMVAFCVALFIMLQGRLWIIIPITLLAVVPVIIFVLLQFPFLVELYTSTFRPGILDRKKNINIGKGRVG